MSSQRYRWLDERVAVLAPHSSLVSDVLAQPASPSSPLAGERVEVLARVSEAMLADPALRSDPAGVAAAYWLRKGNLVPLCEAYLERWLREPTVLRVPAGRVFLVAPANVDTMFLYVWALSFACGNTTVVRLSQQTAPQAAALLACLQRVAAESPVFARSTRFCTYGHDRAVNDALSAWCRQRIAFGGNEALASIRESPLAADGSERAFGSKLSCAVIDAAAYLASPEERRAKLAQSFFNDVTWFDQLACASPQVVFWVGGAGPAREARRQLSDALEVEAQRRGYRPDPSVAALRLAHAFRAATAEADTHVQVGARAFVEVEVSHPDQIEREICGGGYLRHARVESLEQLAAWYQDSDQTVAHFGLDPAALRSFAAAAGVRGIDRVVPIGQALAFSPVWDGHDLVEDLVRRVVVTP